MTSVKAASPEEIQDPIIEIDSEDLDKQATGQEFVPQDAYLLLTLGVLIPAVLLLWGWL